MKIRRYRKVNKNIGFYVNNYGFRKPFQMLVDGTICFAALNNKINLSHDIPTYLQGEIKLLTTQCVIMEMENLGPKVSGALLILKNYSVHKCGHEGKPIPGSKCLLSMLANENKQHYIIATQDRDLQKKIRNIPGIPLLYLHLKTPVLEQPSDVSIQHAKRKLFGLTQYEQEALERLKLEKERKEGEVSQTQGRKTKGKKLNRKDEEVRKPRKNRRRLNSVSSLKKRKQQRVQQSDNKIQSSGSKIEKAKRKKIRIPQHVKEELLKNKGTI